MFKLFISFLLLTIFQTQLRAEGKPWTMVTSIAINESRIAIEIYRGESSTNQIGPFYYEVLSNMSLQSIDRNEFKNNFAKFQTKSALNFNKATPPTEITSSDGAILKIKNTNCHPQVEGPPLCTNHKIIDLNNEINVDLRNICKNNCYIINGEKINNEWWLGLGYFGEYDPRGAGFIVYNQSKQLIYPDEKQNIDPILPSVFKFNKKTESVWIANSEGISLINVKSKKYEKYFFHIGFNTQTNQAQFYLDRVLQDNDTLGLIAMNLKLGVSKKFALAAIGFTDDTRDSLSEIQKYNPDPQSSKEENKLLPFFLDGIKSLDIEVQRYSFEKICYFKEASVYTLIKELNKKNEIKDPQIVYSIKSCFTKLIEKQLIAPGK